MDRLKLRIMAAIMGFPAGPRMEGSALKHRLDQVAAYIREKSKDDREAWLIIFEALCKSNPQAVHGNVWPNRLESLMSYVGGHKLGNAEGMSLDALKQVTSENAKKNAAQAAAKTAEQEAHAKVIDSSKLEKPAKKAKPEPDNSEAHAKVIASQEK